MKGLELLGHNLAPPLALDGEGVATYIASRHIKISQVLRKGRLAENWMKNRLHRTPRELISDSHRMHEHFKVLHFQ